MYIINKLKARVQCFQNKNTIYTLSEYTITTQAKTVYTLYVPCMQKNYLRPHCIIRWMYKIAAGKSFLFKSQKPHVIKLRVCRHIKHITHWACVKYFSIFVYVCGRNHAHSFTKQEYTFYEEWFVECNHRNWDEPNFGHLFGHSGDKLSIYHNLLCMFQVKRFFITKYRHEIISITFWKLLRPHSCVVAV